MAIIYRSEFEYLDCIGVMRSFTAQLLRQFAPHMTITRERVIASSVARGMACVESIGALYQLRHHHDCWILHRTLVERLFHIHALASDGEWQLFYDWSFMKEYEAESVLRNDPVIAKNAPATRFKTSEENRKRYKEIKRKNPQWRRPKAVEVAKEMELEFIYKHSYDYGSRYVHPMGTDGYRDMLRIADLNAETPETTDDSIVVLHNSILVQTAHIQEGMNASALLWRGIAYDAVQGFVGFLRGEQEWDRARRKLQQSGPEFPWCQPGTRNS
jgi:hypothetical protein